MADYITAYFTRSGSPETGLSATVSILRLSDDTVVVNAAAMSEASLAGWYYYDFGAYDAAEDYAITADGGATLFGVERYKHGGSGGLLLDARVTSRSNHDAADVNTTLTVAHGGGPWTTGLTASQGTMLEEIWQLESADENNERVDDVGSIKVPEDGSKINITLTTVGGKVVAQRQP